VDVELQRRAEVLHERDGTAAAFDASCARLSASPREQRVSFPDVSGSRAVLHDVPLVPTQLLEASAGLLTLLVLLWRWPRRRFSGELFALFVLVYGAARVLLELVRGDPRGAAFGLTTAQLTLLAPMALALWAMLRRPAGLAAGDRAL
jgi:prolipoprotein diacylglyceryltransferase